jgi:mRNA-degrading endonuclease RelE of RelBE toxin-antitoxin system
MNYSVIAIPKFNKELKKLVKKYPSLKADFTKLLDSLVFNPMQGKPLGKNCYKIRLAIKSKGKGKSGGARIITNIVVTDTKVYLLFIYDKTKTESITDKELQELLKDLPS